MSIPTRNQWNQLKKAHSIPNGAVAGVNLGQELDKVDKAARGNNQAAYATTVRQYATIANTYHGLASWVKAETQVRASFDAARKQDPRSAAAYSAQGQLAHILSHRGRRDAV